MRISDWSSDVCSSDLRNWIGALVGSSPNYPVSTSRGQRHHRKGVSGAAHCCWLSGGSSSGGSEERRVGIACVSMCRSWWLPSQSNIHTCYYLVFLISFNIGIFTSY